MNTFVTSTRPLVYLTLLSLKNGVIRAFSNVRRLIGLLFFVGYYVLAFIRPYDRSQTAPIPLPPSGPRLTVPSPSLIEPWIFLIFAGLSIFLSVSLPSYKSSFRPADVDVLFATPVNSRVVMIWRLARDYALTLLFPLFFIVIGWRGANVGVQALFNNFPQYGNYVLRALMGSWLLLALAWTCMGYACSLFINRSDQESNRNRLWIYVFAYTPPLLSILYFATQMRSEFTGPRALETLTSPVLKVLSLPATAATEIVMAPLTSNLILAAVGIFTLSLLIGASLKISLSQSGWMYDQAAARGFDAVEIRNLMRKGDRAAVAAIHARSGKVKANRVTARIARLNTSGPRAMLWREAIIQVRSGLGANIALSAIMTSTVGVVAWAARGEARTAAWLGFFFLGFQIFTSLTTGLAMAQQGFVETLRRVDVLKPLPFSPTITVFAEVVGKSIALPLFTSLFSLFLLPIAPALWDEVLANTLFLPTLSILVSSAAFLVTVLFPDVDDPTQRGFRSLVSMLAIVILAAPGLLVGAVLLAYHFSVFLAAILAGVINLGIAVGVAMVGGNLYAHYNLSE